MDSQAAAVARWAAVAARRSPHPRVARKARPRAAQPVVSEVPDPIIPTTLTPLRPPPIMTIAAEAPRAGGGPRTLPVAGAFRPGPRAHATLHPERIILFGSAARGQMNEHSDRWSSSLIGLTGPSQPYGSGRRGSARSSSRAMWAPPRPHQRPDGMPWASFPQCP